MMNENKDDIIEVEPEPVFQPKEPGRLIAQGYEVRTRDYLTRAWRLFMENAGPFLLFATIIIAFNIFIELLPRTVGFMGPLTVFLINAIFLFPFLGGMFIVAARRLKNKETDFSYFFKGFEYFIPLATQGIIIHAIVGGLLFGAYWISISYASFEYALLSMLLLSAAIYFAVAYLFCYMLLIDRKMGPWEAMEASRRIISRRWLAFLGIAAIMLALEVVGALLLIVGLIPATALSLCILTVAYDDVMGISTTEF